VARVRDRFRATTLCALWAWLWLSAPAWAEPLRAGVRISEPADNSLLARVRGQSGDLELAIEPVEMAALESSFAAQLASARAVARERGLRVVVWAARDAQAMRLVVADFALDRVLVRPVSASERSAQEEAAALMTRSALRASLAGSALGQPSEQLLEPAPQVELKPAPEAPPPVAAAKPRPPAVRRWQLELGALSGIDGVTRAGHHALFVRASLRWRWLELGALGAYGLPIEVAAQLADLRLSTHRVEGSAGVSWLERAHWSLSSSLGAGAQLLHLAASARDPGFRASAARASAPQLTAFLRLAYRPQTVGLSLRLGLDVLPTAPKLGYQSDASFVRTKRLWLAQPTLALALSY
jgi:hypothetical protein